MNIQTLKGFRDFLPKEAKKRQYVLDILKKVFEFYGFEPLETPALEYEEVLTGKYGDEGEKLMYKFEDRGKRKVALRYDQTVPLARVVAQYGSAGSPQALPMPFKRYQIQPVWRAENTQKGRYREFLQVDVDTIGSSSPLADAEILTLIYDSFKKLGLEVKIKINDRALIKGINPKFLTIIDKLDKIGKESVIKELKKIDAEDMFRKVSSMEPTENIVEIMKAFQIMGYPIDVLKFDNTLVRGLDYYTGLIIEVVTKSNPSSPALGGGGRYDNLIGIFAGKQIPAVGFSFGFDRLMEAMEKLKLFPDELSNNVLVTIFDPSLLKKSLALSMSLRSSGVNAELFLPAGRQGLDENASLEKQLKYADKKGIRFAVILGPKEVKNGTVMLKDLKNKTQKEVKTSDLIKFLQN